MKKLLLIIFAKVLYFSYIYSFSQGFYIRQTFSECLVYKLLQIKRQPFKNSKLIKELDSALTNIHFFK